MRGGGLFFEDRPLARVTREPQRGAPQQHDALGVPAGNRGTFAEHGIDQCRRPFGPDLGAGAQPRPLAVQARAGKQHGGGMNPGGIDVGVDEDLPASGIRTPRVSSD